MTEEITTGAEKNPVRKWNRNSAVFNMSNFFNSSDFRLTDLGLLLPKRVVVHDGGVVNLDSH